MPDYKALCAATLLVALAGCSSPPEPAQPQWDAPATQMNSSLPHWKENRVTIPTQNVIGHWTYSLTNFSPNSIYSPGAWYAVAHSTIIVVESPDAKSFFTAKSWLQQHGATAVITYTPLLNTMVQKTKITLSR